MAQIAIFERCHGKTLWNIKSKEQKTEKDERINFKINFKFIKFKILTKLKKRGKWEQMGGLRSTFDLSAGQQETDLK